MTRVTVTAEGAGELDVFMGKHLVAQVSATLVLRTGTDVRVRELIFG